MEDQIVPLLYKDNDIGKQESLQLLNGNFGQRKQVNGLRYKPLQLPSEKRNKGWKRVVRCSSMPTSFIIKNAAVGNIYIEYIDGQPSDAIQQAVQFYLSNHTNVRNEDGESGVMCPFGQRVDVRSSCLTHYKNTKKKLPGDVNDIMESCLVDFNSVLCGSCCSSIYRDEIRELTRKNNTLTYQNEIGQSLHVLPTYCVSSDLSNSLHCDNDDGVSFAIFYRKKPNGRTWFVIPSLGLAIEIAGTVILSWDGRLAQHASITTAPGIHSLFGSSSPSVTMRRAVEKAFSVKKYNRVKANQSIYTRRLLFEMRHDPKLDISEYKKRTYMNRKATVISVDGECIYVLYDGKLKYLGTELFHRNHVVRMDIVDKFLC